MPFIGFKCENLKQDEYFHTLADCLQETNPVLSYPILAAIWSSIVNNYHKAGYLSASALTACPICTVLERKYNYIQSAPLMWWAVRGTFIHQLLESISCSYLDLDRFLFEYSIEDYIGDNLIHGTIDCIDRERHILTDYKTISDRGLSYILKEGPKFEHILQTNIYKWLLDLHGIPIKKIQIVYITLMRIEATALNSLKQYTLGEVPLLSYDDIWKHIKKPLKSWKLAFTDNQRLFKQCPEHMSWKCNNDVYSPVKEYRDYILEHHIRDYKRFESSKFFKQHPLLSYKGDITNACTT